MLKFTFAVIFLFKGLMVSFLIFDGYNKLNVCWDEKKYVENVYGGEGGILFAALAESTMDPWGNKMQS